jgi:hypothetical protein
MSRAAQGLIKKLGSLGTHAAAALNEVTSSTLSLVMLLLGLALWGLPNMCVRSSLNTYRHHTRNSNADML